MEQKDYTRTMSNCAVCTQSYPTLHDPMDCSPPGSSVRGICQARILEWVAISFSRGFFPVRDGTQVSCISCIGRQIFTAEPPEKPHKQWLTQIAVIPQAFVKNLQLSDCILDARDPRNVIRSLYSTSFSDGKTIMYQFKHEKIYGKQYPNFKLVQEYSRIL